LAQARAAAAEASANLADASANAERARSLANTGALSGQQTGQYLTGELTAQARLESARANLQQQELRMQQTQVLAPDSGMVVARSATVGAVANPGSELFRLIRQGRLEWRAEVTATELARIQTGGKVSVTTAAGTAVAGKVRKVGPTVDPQTRAALVYVDLSTPVRALSGVKAGMFARGEFELGNSNALVVPQQAVVVRDGFNYLFRIDASNKVAQRKVQIGRRINESVEITDGIGPDATIAVTGAGFLNDGDTVRVNNAASPK
jgi:RND family efflux transporter MFP subunit